jgi:hypothetical protein
MSPILDIFQIEKNGSIVWKGTSETAESALLRVRILWATDPGDYVILNQATGQRTVIAADSLK